MGVGESSESLIHHDNHSILVFCEIDHPIRLPASNDVLSMMAITNCHIEARRLQIPSNDNGQHYGMEGNRFAAAK